MEPHELDAVTARELIGRRQLSPVELLDSCINRIERVNPALNAVVTTCFERAQLEAIDAERSVMRGDRLGLLHGLPALIKDLNETAGVRTTFCSPIHRENVPVDDDAVVARMRGQGAVVVGKTNSSEFGIGSNTTNPVFGPSGNPFAPHKTCGGSSGGSAVALATEMVPIANGSDSGASIRNPAAFCGIFGLRPSPGLVASGQRTIGLSTNGVEGPLGRTVADNALLLAAMAGHDTTDVLSFPTRAEDFAGPAPADITSLRIGWSVDLSFAPIDAEVREVFHEKVARLSALFGSWEPCEPAFHDAEEAYWGTRAVYVLSKFGEHYVQRRSQLGPDIIANVEDALAMSAADIARAMTLQTRIYRDFQPLFNRFDVIVTPAVNVLPFPHATLSPVEVGGRPARHYAEWYSITYGITLTGHPAIAVPVGLDSRGTPFGLQMVGPRFGDRRLLEIALGIEQCLQGIDDLRRPRPDHSGVIAPEGVARRGA